MAGSRSPALRIELAAIELRFARPLVTASGTHAHRSTWLIRATDSAGTVGYGEAAPLPGHGGESHDAVEPALAALARGLQRAGAGMFDAAGPIEPGAVAAKCRAIRDVAQESPCARAGIELALCDLAARRSGVPLHRWLAGAAGAAGDARTAVVTTVPVNATIGADAPERAAERARRAVAAGFVAIKVKVGAGAADREEPRDDRDRPGDDRSDARADDRDIARIAAVRAAVGTGVAIRADANGAWGRDRAEAMCGRLAAFDLEYLEQPVAAADVEGLAALRAAGILPIAADEALLEPDGPRRVSASGAADVWILKPSLSGGPLAALEMAALARRSGAALTVTSALDSAVGRSGAAHVAAALAVGGGLRACGLATGAGDVLREDVAAGPAIEAGRIVLTGAPGLGIANLDVPERAWRAVGEVRS